MKIKRTDWELAGSVLADDDPLMRRIAAKLQVVDTDHVSFRVSREDRSRIDEAIAIGRLRVIQRAEIARQVQAIAEVDAIVQQDGDYT